MVALVQNIFDQIFLANGSRVLWREKGWERSFADLARDLEKSRRKSRFAGLKAGSLWAFSARDHYQSFVLCLTAMLEGWVAVPLSHRLKGAWIEPYLAQLPLSGWIGQTPGEFFDGVYLSWDQMQESHNPADLREETSPCLVIFTSGSSGTPKGIVHSLASLRSSAEATLDFYQANTGEISLLSLDLSHIGGFQIALRCFLGGLTCVAGFEPQEISEALRYTQPDFLSLVPTQLQRLLQDDNARGSLSRCRAILLGGATTPSYLIEQGMALGLSLSLTYGSSETASQVAALPPGVAPEREGDVGEIFPLWIAIVGQDQRLCLKGPALCMGWWQGKIFYPLTPEDGFLTPDKAYIQSGRRLQIVGRQDTVFQVGGENLSPREITDALLELSCDGDWIVLPQEDREYGQVPILIFRSELPPPSQRTIELCLQGKLPRIKHPRALYWDKSSQVNKPSRAVYQRMLAEKHLELLWTRV